MRQMPITIDKSLAQDIYYLEEDGEGQKAPTPTGHALTPWEGQVEITPEDVAEAIRDWDTKAPRRWRGLLFTERENG